MKKLFAILTLAVISSTDLYSSPSNVETKRLSEVESLILKELESRGTTKKGVAEVYYELAIKSYHEKRYDIAMILIEKALKQNPDLITQYSVAKIYILLADNQMDKARDIYKKIQKDIKDSTEVEHLSYLLNQDKTSSEYEDHYEPDSSSVRRKISDTLILLKRKDIIKARKTILDVDSDWLDLDMLVIQAVLTNDSSACIQRFKAKGYKLSDKRPDYEFHFHICRDLNNKYFSLKNYKDLIDEYGSEDIKLLNNIEL